MAESAKKMSTNATLFAMIVTYIGTVILFYVLSVPDVWVNALFSTIGFWVFYFYIAPFVKSLATK